MLHVIGPLLLITFIFVTDLDNIADYWDLEM